jgi:hypothetical protein
MLSNSLWGFFKTLHAFQWCCMCVSVFSKDVGCVSSPFEKSWGSTGVAGIRATKTSLDQRNNVFWGSRRRRLWLKRRRPRLKRRRPRLKRRWLNQRNNRRVELPRHLWYVQLLAVYCSLFHAVAAEDKVGLRTRFVPLPDPAECLFDQSLGFRV